MLTPNEKKQIKIVIVDDSDFSRRSLMEILEADGFKIVGEASNATSAFQLAHASDANLFIIDVVMPEVSGIELAKTISDKIGHIKIIMTSSLQAENIVIDAISSGANDFIQKPFDKKTLLKSIEKLAQDILKKEEEA